MATGPANEESLGSGGLSAADKLILQQPYAAAVSFMGYRPDLIVHAVKLLQNQDGILESGMLLKEVEHLLKVEERGRTLPSVNRSKAPKRQRSGSLEDNNSDSESDCTDSMPPEKNDLQTDGEQVLTLPQVKAVVLPPAADKVKEGGVKKKAEDTATLQQKLRALRQENQLLKTRQQCRSCHSRPVSITFLPCGHFSYCYDCGQTFRACPICRKTILADVRTFLA
ncbi:uncharacterized protein LOC143292710 [Babylonia areolata]|uniref:uncharacterized protein LOC143292710 n=1 Tax=Babylonia areolata TaxID=304850 RepID=UPI003FD0344A